MPRAKGSKGHTDLEELFLKKATITPSIYPALGDCWIWTGATMKPRFDGDKIRGQLNTKTWGAKYAHQWSCHHWNGSPLPVESNMCVTHECDTPLCVNPAHLKYDTWDKNFNDMYERNPTALGRKPPTEEQMALARKLVGEKAGITRIAKELNMSANWVRRILRDYFPATQ
jgi:hypothetical protein